MRNEEGANRVENYFTHPPTEIEDCGLFLSLLLIHCSCSLLWLFLGRTCKSKRLDNFGWVGILLRNYSTNNETFLLLLATRAGRARRTAIKLSQRFVHSSDWAWEGETLAWRPLIATEVWIFSISVTFDIFVGTVKLVTLNCRHNLIGIAAWRAIRVTGAIRLFWMSQKFMSILLARHKFF